MQRIKPEFQSFGAEVRRLRKAAGLNQQRLADLVNVTRSYITQVECGRTRCRRDLALRLDRALKSGTTLAEAWDELLESIKSDKYPEFFANFPRAEQSASMLRSYEDRVVYGLFQSEAYARVLLNDDDALKNRMRRQEILNRLPAPSITGVMDETVLYREVGGKTVMREQLERLLELSEMSNLNLQVAPIRYIRNVWATFTIATLPDQRQVVYTAKAYGGETSSSPPHVALANEAMATLQAEALNVRDTRALIRRVIEERWT
ncbi:helix-turn-helix transcriptional regulator [Actinomadura luteofluorescens]|uniref:helix-turn-helix domain-containing protein n=1 Tax=Actinomadura luteofluorescens TaxID=46163 RepID=UPI00216443A6|nr:helix-turn-helix transcriptional regulator [Actinomadura glauciflava]MCR3741790.1 Helix-turn-helix domain-containing protein [Actinomadura glauciflava]